MTGTHAYTVCRYAMGALSYYSMLREELRSYVQRIYFSVSLIAFSVGIPDPRGKTRKQRPHALQNSIRCESSKRVQIAKLRDTARLLSVLHNYIIILHTSSWLSAVCYN